MEELEGGSWTQYQKLVLKLLEQHDEKLDTLRIQLSESKGDSGSIRESISSMKQDIDILLNLVRDGSPGVASILTRIDHLEGGLSNLKSNDEQKKKDVKEIQNYRRALFISVMGILATVIWSLVQRFYLEGK